MGNTQINRNHNESVTTGFKRRLDDGRFSFYRAQLEKERGSPVVIVYIAPCKSNNGHKKHIVVLIKKQHQDTETVGLRTFDFVDIFPASYSVILTAE